MLSANDFIAQYKTLSDEELYQIHVNHEGYSPEAGRISALATAMAQQGVDKEHIKTRLTSPLLSQEQIDDLTDQAYHIVKRQTHIPDPRHRTTRSLIPVSFPPGARSPASTAYRTRTVPRR